MHGFGNLMSNPSCQVEIVLAAVGEAAETVAVVSVD